MEQSAARRPFRRRIVATLVPLLFIAWPVLGVTPAERNALLALYDATGGPHWMANSGWGGAVGTECTWTKISCDANGSVVNILLGSNNLVGTIPPEIGNLSKLQRLYLDNNKLSGPIPPEIERLTLLTELSLATNQLSGAIPQQLGSLTSLKFVFLGSNTLEGPIPSQIGNLTTLQDLFLNSNKLTGEIPDLSRLTSLAKLNLRNNKLTGTIPSFGTLANLKELILDTNQLSGPIPSLRGLGKLEILRLHTNQLTGSIPADLGLLTSLTELALHTNPLSGPVPPQIGAVTNLKFLYLCCSNLEGPIPPQIGNLRNLQELFLGNNELTGEIPDLSRLTALTKISLPYNKLTGAIPPLGTLANLRNLVINVNELSGPVPPLDGLKSLETLYLNQNRLTGGFPDVGSLSALSELALYSNQLSGPVTQLGTLTNLRFALLSGNRFSSLPSLAGLKKLEVLDVSLNQLTGPIPNDLGLLVSLQRLDLSSNALSGSIPDLGGLSQLRVLRLAKNQLSGAIPDSLTSLAALEDLRLNSNQFSGPIPAGIGRLGNLLALDLSINQMTGAVPPTIVNLSRLKELYLSSNSLSGTFLSEVSKMTSLQKLHASNNQLEGFLAPDIGRVGGLTQLLLYNNKVGGALPDSLGDLAEMTDLQIGANQFSGPIPASLGRLTRLQKLLLNRNQLTGELPATLGNLTNLIELNVYSNRMSGTVPPSLGNLSRLEILSLGTNSFHGPIPPQLGRLTALKQLVLSANRFDGPIPRELGALTRLEKLAVDANQLTGPIPPELTNLQRLVSISLKFNGLTSNDAALDAFLRRLQSDWFDFQNVPPADLRLAGIDGTTAVLSWRSVSTKWSGAYQIAVATPPGGPLALQQTTAGKWVSSAIVTGLTPSTDYTFAVRSVGYPVPGSSLDRPYQQNQLASEYVAVAARTPSAVGRPVVVVLSFPSGPLIRGLGVDRDDRYVLLNIGLEPATITVTQSGTFFTQSPTSFTLAPGASRTVTLRGTEQAPGVYEGTSTPSGEGVPSGLTIPVSMLSLSFGSANVVAVPSATRIDLSTETSGTVDFTNAGADTLLGVFVSDVDWIEPQTRGLIEIRPGQRLTLRFNVNRTKRPLIDGSLTGGLYLVYPKTAAAALAMLDNPLTSHTGLGVTTVSVVDTARPPVTQGAPPPLAAGEVALFIPGVGTIRGANARYISDINLVNASGSSALSNVRLYYTPETVQASSARADLPSLPPGSLVSYGNVITSVFQSESTGTLQIRMSASVDSITASARIFNVEGARGTFGTAIPVFRSDRGAAAGEEIVLTGVRKDAATRTNLFIQEMGGRSARFDIRFLDRHGGQIGSYAGDVSPFSLRRVLDQVPSGAVTAVITNARDSAGVLSAYATPLDARSNDFWSVVDWSRQLGFDRFEPMLVPIAGSLRGLNNTFFRSDLMISNRSPLAQKGVLRFVSRSAQLFENLIELPGGASLGVDDLLGESFRLTSDAGYLVFAPQCDSGEESLAPGACDAAFAIASRNFATVGDDPGTFGTGVPALALASALRAGQSRIIGGIEDVASTRGPGTYRTNVGLLETSGAPVTVRVTVIKPQTSGLLSFVSGASMDITLGPREQRQINGVASAVLGPGNEVRNASILFQVVGGEGAVVVYASSVDNGTGDAVLRVE